MFQIKIFKRFHLTSIFIDLIMIKSIIRKQKSMSFQSPDVLT